MRKPLHRARIRSCVGPARGGAVVRLFLALAALVSCSGGGSVDAVPAPSDGGAEDVTFVTPDSGPLEGICSGAVGLVRPLPACSIERPCARLAAEVDAGISGAITTPSDEPRCPPGLTLLARKVAGFDRYACVASPPGASASSPRPLVLWFHPGGEGAATISETKLVAKSASYDLTGDGRLGFHLAVVQGRNLHFVTKEPRDGRHHDFYHRDLRAPSGNPDIAFADDVIDGLVSAGAVDPKRVFVMGWSNGAFFGQLYTLARHGTATPGGARVASAAVFAAASPFDDVRWDPFAGAPRAGGTSCKLAQLPRSSAPIFLVYRTCDAAVAATPTQASCFDTEPGYTTEPWIAEAAAAGLSLTPLRLGGREPGASLDEAATAATSPPCTSTACAVPPSVGCLCLVNHLIWPDGTYKGSAGRDREPDMLDFLRAHPLP